VDRWADFGPYSEQPDVAIQAEPMQHAVQTEVISTVLLFAAHRVKILLICPML